MIPTSYTSTQDGVKHVWTPDHEVAVHSSRAVDVHARKQIELSDLPKDEIVQIRSLIAAILLAAVPSIALAQIKPVKIGVLNDQSSVYADSQGFGSVIAARLAVEDYAKNLGLTVEVV